MVESMTNFGTGLAETVETSLEFSSRLMTPFHESDALSLVFALSALVLASVFSWTGVANKGRDDSFGLGYWSSSSSPFPLDAAALHDNEIEKSIEKIKNNVIYYDKTKSKNKPLKKSFRMKDYQKAVEAFEDFMEWSRNATRDNELLDDLIDLTISKSKGERDPSDVMYHITMDIIYDLFDKVCESIDYYF